MTSLANYAEQSWKIRVESKYLVSVEVVLDI